MHSWRPLPLPFPFQFSRRFQKQILVRSQCLQFVWPRTHHNVKATGQLLLQQPKGLAQQPFQSIPLHRIPCTSRYRQSQPGILQVVRQAMHHQRPGIHLHPFSKHRIKLVRCAQPHLLREAKSLPIPRCTRLRHLHSVPPHTSKGRNWYKC